MLKLKREKKPDESGSDVCAALPAVNGWAREKKKRRPRGFDTASDAMRVYPTGSVG